MEETEKKLLRNKICSIFEECWQHHSYNMTIRELEQLAKKGYWAKFVTGFDDLPSTLQILIEEKTKLKIGE
tara:strand:+ start:161 stop:373 length:213 start_codon:yes stop_codon:yes gene_type:complete